MRLSKLAVIGALALVGLSSANDFENDERETISMEEITREMIQKYGSDIFQGNKGDGGLRKLGNTLPCQQWSCEHGSNPNLVMTFAGRKWGSCVDMDPCLCGAMPLQMAYWCPKECRLQCGGTCATEASCPNGFIVEANGTAAILNYPLPPPPWPEWPCGLGEACPTPAPTPVPSAMPSVSAAPSVPSVSPTVS